MLKIKYWSPVFDGCYDDTTELLTGSGWKLFKDIVFEDKICTLNKNHVIEYHCPDKIIEKNWDGQMYKISGRFICVDLLVTPDHNMYVQKEYHNRVGKGVGWIFEEAKKGFGLCRYFKKDGIWNKQPIDCIEICGRKLKTEHWLEFLGYYLSEGSSTITKRHDYIVQIRQYGENLSKMAKALARVTVGKINIRKDGRVIVNDKHLAVYLKEKFGHCYDKYIPRHILNNCSKAQLRILFDALMLGDGHDNRTNGGGSCYYTSSVKLRDGFMELLLKIGLNGSYIKGHSKGDIIKIYDKAYAAKEDHWVVRIKFKNNICGKIPYNKARKTYEEFVDYKGKVYCVNVPNHTLYVRRNGCPVWCGNSGYGSCSRHYIKALVGCGVDLTLSPVSFERARPDLGGMGEFLDKYVNRQIDYDINLIHLTPEHYPMYREPGKINVGYTVWETSKIHHDWIAYCNCMDAIIVPCEWNVKVFRDSGVTVPVYCVPHVINTEGLDEVKEFPVVGPSKNDYIFYSIFQFCYDDQTRVLTKAGFKHFKDLSYDDCIATLNLETEELEYHKPDKIVSFDRDDKMLHLKGSLFDCCVTPDHKMVVRDIDSRKWRLQPLNTLLSKGHDGRLIVKDTCRTKKGCKWVGTEKDVFYIPNPASTKSGTPSYDINKGIPMDSFLEFLGWYLSEGSINKNTSGYYINITQIKNKQYIDEITECIKAMGFTPFYTGKDVRFTSKQMCLYLERFGKCYEKYIPSFVKELSSSQIKIILSSLFKGDGSFDNVYLRWQKYVTTSKKLAEDVLECLIKVGISGAISAYDPINKKPGFIGGRPIYSKKVQYTVSVNHSRLEPSMYYAEISEKDYKGKVYCAVVKNHNMLVERNGKVLFCGNTERKDPVSLLKAYWHAFDSTDNVALVIKTYRGDYSDKEKEAIIQTLRRTKVGMVPQDGKDYAPVYLVLDLLAEKEVLGLHKWGDCFISLNRGEGFGLPSAEASAFGNPVITTGYGGTNQFLNSDNSYLIDYIMVPVSGMPFIKWYTSDQCWAHVDVCGAADAMRHVYENRQASKTKGALAKENIENNFSYKTIGNLYIQILKEILTNKGNN